MSKTTLDAHPHANDDPRRAADDDRTATASDRLWATLHAHPGATTEQLASDAGIGRSTAAKILARWVADGTVDRTAAGGRKSSASRFAVAAPAGPAGASTPADATTAPQAISSRAAPDAASHTVTTPPGDARGDGTNQPTSVAAGTSEAGASADLGNSGTPEPDPSAGSDRDDAAPTDDATATSSESATGTEPATTSSDPPRRTASESTRSEPILPPKALRLSPGALHGMVEDYLREHPGDEFGPTKIGRDLGRSSGAVGNALERLVAAGYAVRTKDRPKRYALATAEHPPK